MAVLMPFIANVAMTPIYQCKPLPHCAIPPLSTPHPPPTASDESVVAVTTLQSSLTTTSREDQLSDKAIGPFFRAIEAGCKLGSDTLKGMSQKSRHLHQQWDFKVKYGKFWRIHLSQDGATETLHLLVSAHTSTNPG